MSDISEGYHDAFGYDDEGYGDGYISGGGGGDFCGYDPKAIVDLLYPKFETWILIKRVKESDKTIPLDPDKYYNIFFDCFYAYALARGYAHRHVERAIYDGLNSSNKLYIELLDKDTILNMLKSLDEDNRDDVPEGLGLYFPEEDIPF